MQSGAGSCFHFACRHRQARLRQRGSLSHRQHDLAIDCPCTGKSVIHASYMQEQVHLWVRLQELVSILSNEVPVTEMAGAVRQSGALCGPSAGQVHTRARVHACNIGSKCRGSRRSSAGPARGVADVECITQIVEWGI